MAKISERPNLPWRFTVVDVPAVNAFAVPGGGIYITRGIMPFLDNEAELAGVLGHEIGHVTARHSAQQYTRQIGGQVGPCCARHLRPGGAAVRRPDGRRRSACCSSNTDATTSCRPIELGAKYESHARLGSGGGAGVPVDARTPRRSGGRSARRAELAVHASGSALAREATFSRRSQQLKAAGAAVRHQPRRASCQRIDGILYGDNPEQGIARGNVFLHPVLRFRIDFPEKWEIANSPQQVVAKAPGADVFMLLQLVQKPQGRNIQEIALNSMSNAGFRCVDGERHDDQRPRRVRRRLPGTDRRPWCR